jgi:3-deoxy-manno-octulosonate cytidylyltransferase (CMP-KDO synthetase)
MKIIIPARLNSARVQHKMLRDIQGRTVIEHTVNRTREAAARLGAELYVITDADEISDKLADYTGVKILDSRIINPTYAPVNGTERVALAAEYLNSKPSDVIINVQGDKYGIVAEAVVQLAQHIEEHSFVMASRKHDTLYCLCENLSHEEATSGGVVKVVTTRDDRALFFTRAPVANAKKHCGIYGYYACFLNTYLHMPARALEKNEGLEQMRVLENGGNVHCPELQMIPTAGRAINCEQDLAYANRDYDKRLHIV